MTGAIAGMLVMLCTRMPGRIMLVCELWLEIRTSSKGRASSRESLGRVSILGGGAGSRAVGFGAVTSLTERSQPSP